jgi:NAD-dependent deacetylase
MRPDGEQPPLERARQLLQEATFVVAFTGAGISAESGIPTYRDCDDALWRQYDPAQFAEINAFMRDSSLYWRFFQDVRYAAISAARPNPGHRALAILEQEGRLKAIITQNIDGLHQEAGSREVIELHGNTRRIRCLACGAAFAMDAVFEQLKRELPPPCRSCGGMLKPEVVFFGEALPERALARAADLVGRCDLLIAVGSSLVVYPAAALPVEAKRRGAALIIVNKTPTPHDRDADVVLRLAAGEVLPRLVAPPPPPGDAPDGVPPA